MGHHPPPRADGKLPTRDADIPRDAGAANSSIGSRAARAECRVTARAATDLALNRYLYDAVGRTWLWYERKLKADEDVLGYFANAKGFDECKHSWSNRGYGARSA